MANIIRWEPFNEAVSLRDAMDRLFEESFITPRFFAPLREGVMGTLPLDVVETENDVIVKASVPGLKPEDIDITVVGDTLTIKGETKSEKKEEKNRKLQSRKRANEATASQASRFHPPNSAALRSRFCRTEIKAIAAATVTANREIGAVSFVQIISDAAREARNK